MKKLISELIIINLMLVISVAMTGCGGNEAVNNESVNKAEKSTKADSVLYVGNQAPLPLEKLQQDFTLEDAKNTGCVVFEDLDVTSGQEIWEDIFKGLISSQSGDGILHKLVYNDYIDK